MDGKAIGLVLAKAIKILTRPVLLGVGTWLALEGQWPLGVLCLALYFETRKTNAQT